MGRPTAGWGSINCAGAGQPGRVWQARTAPGVAMLPGEAGINVRKTARYAGKDCDPLQQIPSSLKALASQAAAFNWADGPQAFVETRNSVVHPPKRANSPKPPRSEKRRVGKEGR